MYTLSVNTVFDWNPLAGRQSARLMRMFSLRLSQLKQQLRLKCTLTLNSGQICFITGPVGSGKSILLNEFFEQVATDKRIRTDQIPLASETTVIDSVPTQFPKPLNPTKVLGVLGLGNDLAMLTSPASLSTGQRCQYQLARAILSERPWLLVDDFTTFLDRISACVTAYHLRNIVTQTDKICILASCHTDILKDLQPDVIVILSANTGSHIIYRDNTQAYESLCNRC